MKKLLFLLFLIPAIASADGWDKAVSKNAGNYAYTFPVTVTTHTATAIIDQSYAILSAAIDIYVNNAYTLWIGSNTTTLQTTGFPIGSSNTYTTDGTFTGSLYGMVDSAAGADANVRVIYWLKSDALR